MGKPKFSRKKYETPSHPWQEDRIKGENELIKKYGLKNKREIWKAKTVLRRYRGQARELMAKIRGGDPQTKKESEQLLMHLNRMNILPPKSTLDDVLALDTESILSRRLQTLTYLKGLANTPFQARQLISHGHISIGNKKVTIPSYMVTKDEEGDISYIDDSPLNDVMHPARPRADFKTVPVKKETKTKEVEEPKKEEKPSEESKEAPKEEKLPSEEKSEGEEKPGEGTTAKPVEEPIKPEEKPIEEQPEETTEKPKEEPAIEKTEVKEKKEPEKEETKEEASKVKEKDKEEGDK
jgi:small subunit ribosomal protein S4